MAAPSDADACPNCDEHVEALITYSVGTIEPGGEMRSPDTQSKQCPRCGKWLRRLAGEPWRIDENRSE